MYQRPGQVDKAQDVLDRIMLYRIDSDHVHIGFDLAPDAVFSCKELTEFIQNGYGYHQLPAYAPKLVAAL